MHKNSKIVHIFLGVAEMMKSKWQYILMEKDEV